MVLPSRLGLGLLVVSLAALAAWAVPAAARPAPGGLAFYEPPRPLPAGKDGTVIRSRRIGNPVKAAARTWLVLYRSRAAGKRGSRPAAVSGTVMVPRGRPPRRGWPVVTWGHGTTGIADKCAPSRSSDTDNSAEFMSPELERWLRAGYAVARTDYAGLGTPGTHPYLHGDTEARSMIDIVRAARRLDRRVARRFVAVGFSQGGQGALFAGARAAAYAPELRLRGVAAFAPGSHVLEQAKAIGQLTQPNTLSAYAALVAAGAAAASPQIEIPRIVSDAALALWPQIQRRCLGGLRAADSFGGLAPAALERAGADLTALYRVLRKEHPALRIDAPVLLLQNETDPEVPKALTDRLKDQLEALGNEVRYRTFPAAGHASVIKTGAAAFENWLHARLGR